MANIEISEDMSPEEIKTLALSGKLSWKGKKLYFNPFVPPKKEDIEFSFPGFAICHGTLYYYTPEEEEEKEEVKEEGLPSLVLKDRHGAFADLWVGDVAYHEISKPTDGERGWEKDLLETGFIKKMVDSSHYYCPMDKVAKSISFLLEIGWKVVDVRGRVVVKQSGEEIDCSMERDAFIVKGRVKYSEHEIDLTKVVGAFNRRERFIELDQRHVALIDFEHLGKEEIVDGAIRVKKSHLGVMDDLFASAFNVKRDLTMRVESTLPSVDFKGTLHPYQQEGVNWLSFLHTAGLSALLADEMGLGKTIQVLGFISTLKISLPILVVMPTSLLFNWRIEVEKFLPGFPCYIHSGPNRLKELPKQGIILTSYAILRTDFSLFSEFSVIVLDEAQTIKNPDSQAAKCACALKGDFRLCMTGTPIENKFLDMESIFRFLLPDLIIDTPKRVRPFILRRKKKDVAKELPPKYEQTVYVEMGDEQKQLYDEWLAKTRARNFENKIEIFEAILRLRQICCHPHLVGESGVESAKLERFMQDLEEISGQGNKVLVFSQFTKMLGLIKTEIEKRGWKYVYLDGNTKDREAVVQQFQGDENVFIFLISLKAGGVGLNLNAADYVFIYDPWWNEAAENQAIDRAHRLGGLNSVIARRYVTALSIEEKIMRLKENKAKLFTDVLDFEQVPLSLEDLYSFLS